MMISMNPRTEYQVTIFYREPSYELRAGRKKEPYSASYRVRAGGKDRAQAMALRLFKERQQGSMVSWIREVEKIEVRPVRKSSFFNIKAFFQSFLQN